MTDAEYNEWFDYGYDAYGDGFDTPPEDASDGQAAAWWDGYNTAKEEEEG